jgi:hypothetical protein
MSMHAATKVLALMCEGPEWPKILGLCSFTEARSNPLLGAMAVKG